MTKTSSYDYYLPENQIAQTPACPRDSSRLLVYDRKKKEIEHKRFYDILDYLKEGDVLCRNVTKVIPARFFAKAKSGKLVEILLLKRLKIDEWEALVKPGKKARISDVLEVENLMQIEVVGILQESGIRILKFIYDGVFEDLLSKIGEMPLPPYITEKLKDQNRYQTVYCQIEGSAAAPTAGLHFTPELIEKIKKKGVIIADLVLHVGLGTFRPVKEDDFTNHQMHKEEYFVSEETAKIINQAKAENRRIIAVGTTTVRTLESAFWDGKLQSGANSTEIFIYPPYKFKCVDGLITNFHLPKSTLLMLVSAFCSREEVLDIYNVAVGSGYRFFSFGDACFFL